MTTNAIKRLLTDAMGGQVGVNEAPDAPFHPRAAFHPRAFSFYIENAVNAPALSRTPIFDLLMTFNEAGDSEVHRIERKGQMVFYFNVDNMSDNANFVSGQGLVCVRGSADEDQFIQAALVAATDSAVGPLRSALWAISEAKRALPPSYVAALRKELFGS